MKKSQNRGIYLPEWQDLDKMAASESGRTGKPLTTGSLIRKILQKEIAKWVKKNPEK